MSDIVELNYETPRTDIQPSQKGRNMLIVARRDSVCAGDDIDAPHEQRFSMPATATIMHLFLELEKMRYLPSIAGENERWEAYLNQKLICRFQKDIGNPSFVVPGDTPLSKFASDTPEIIVNLRYFCSFD